MAIRHGLLFRRVARLIIISIVATLGVIFARSMRFRVSQPESPPAGPVRPAKAPAAGGQNTLVDKPPVAPLFIADGGELY